MQTIKCTENMSSKDASNFRNLIVNFTQQKLFETKQYKKGLKQSQKLLESIPNHLCPFYLLETLSLKGIFKFMTGSQQEGFKICKQALKKNFQSQLCWHTYGILFRSKKNYAEASKCYNQALKFDPQNQAILRDLALLQVQAKQYDLHCQTRLKILNSKSGILGNWIGYAVANHIKGDLEMALNVMKAAKRLIDTSGIKPLQKSQIQLYNASVLLQGMKFQKVLIFLQQKQQGIIDKLAYNEISVQAYLNLRKYEQAEKIIDTLLKQMNNNERYIEWMKIVRNVSQQRQSLYSFYKFVQQTYQSQVAGLKKLFFIDQQERFILEFSNFIKKPIQKAIPNLFNHFKTLYYIDSNYSKIQKALILHQESFRKKEFPFSQDWATPLCLLWSLYLLSQHYNLRSQTYNKAFEYIQQAIKHTPTCIELYLQKAKILKNMHQYYQAALIVQKAFSFDLSDRFLNNKCIKYFLRVGKIEKAQECLKMFVPDALEGSVYDLQTMWYEIQMGKAFLNKKNWGCALRHFDMVVKHYNDIQDDMFDFHAYSLRKFTLRAYIQSIKGQNCFYKSVNYLRMAYEYIPVLIYVEQKKIKEEFNKQHSSKEQKKSKKQNKNKKKNAVDVIQKVRERIDFYGIKYFKNIDPLQQALSIANNLVWLPIDDAPTKKNRLLCQALIRSAQVYILKNKPLLLIKLLQKIKNLKRKNEERHFVQYKALLFCKFILIVSKLNNDNQIIKQIVKDFLTNFLQQKTLEQFNQNFFSQIKSQIPQWHHDILGQFLLLVNQCKLIKNNATRTQFYQYYVAELEKGKSFQETIFLFLKIKGLYEEIGSDLKKKLQREFKQKTNLFSEIIQLEKQQKKQETNQAKGQISNEAQDKQKKIIGEKIKIQQNTKSNNQKQEVNQQQKNQ